MNTQSFSYKEYLWLCAEDGSTDEYDNILSDSVAMENAKPEVKSIAKQITTNNNNSGVAKIIREKFLDGRKIEITSTEDKMLKLFFAIMSFRSTNAKEQLTRGLSQESREYYKYFQPNEDFEDFWKRNLGYLVQCRSVDDVMTHPDIDPPIKLFMQRDANGLLAKYFVVVEAKDGDGFILGEIGRASCRERV